MREEERIQELEQRVKRLEEERQVSGSGGRTVRILLIAAAVVMLLMVLIGVLQFVSTG
ncbi:hypothetical protein ACE6ED_09975 [Paenibacillus sp. CN-4]|uniref:hypothetical protein n=1 Tax=Paenibacillus nanchangensis TaxID=3348343 RepID=UPI00397B0E80